MSYINSIQKAYSIAAIAHKGQFDKGGNPYINHPVYVASLVNSEDEKIVALLHDVIEDTDITLDELAQQGFCNKVLSAIDAITKRAGELYDDYFVRVCSNDLAVAVKIADMTHNSDINRIPNPTQKDYDRVKKYKQKILYLNNYNN